MIGPHTFRYSEHTTYTTAPLPDGAIVNAGMALCRRGEHAWDKHDGLCNRPRVLPDGQIAYCCHTRKRTRRARQRLRRNGW